MEKIDKEVEDIFNKIGEVFDYKNELKRQVKSKIENEYYDFIKELKTNSKEVIIERAYEKVCKEEMMYIFDKMDLDIPTLKILNKSKNILNECYDEWIGMDGNLNEMLEYAVENTIENCKLNSKKSKEKSVR